MDNNTTKSAFDKNATKIDDMQNWISKNSYQGGYDKKLYKHKSKPKVVVAVKPKPKAVVVKKPKVDLVANAIADRERRYAPYKTVTPLGN